VPGRRLGGFPLSGESTPGEKRDVRKPIPLVCQGRPQKPWPAGLERSFAEMSPVVYETMNGPSEFAVTGRFRDWDVFERLGEIRVPTLVMGGDTTRSASII
jgi:pimeloyl-ACP methyl ester carboxylesterase